MFNVKKYRFLALALLFAGATIASNIPLTQSVSAAPSEVNPSASVARVNRMTVLMGNVYFYDGKTTDDDWTFHSVGVECAAEIKYAPSAGGGRGGSTPESWTLNYTKKQESGDGCGPKNTKTLSKPSNWSERQYTVFAGGESDGKIISVKPDSDITFTKKGTYNGNTVYIQDGVDAYSCPLIIRKNTNWVLIPLEKKSDEDSVSNQIRSLFDSELGVGDTSCGPTDNDDLGIFEQFGLPESYYDAGAEKDNYLETDFGFDGKEVGGADLGGSSIPSIAAGAGIALNGPLEGGGYTGSDSSVGGDGTGAFGDGDDEASSCAIDGIGWLICPVVRFVSRITDASYTVVSAMLSVQPLSTNASSDTYKAWEVMRNIANICFVIAFLIIIYSQITGAGVSNYGIKKMLPKIVIAAILVNVSYWICAIAVDLSNILGTAIKDLIDGLNAGLINEDAQSGNGVWSKLAAIVLVAGVALLVGLSAFLPMVILAVMAIVTVLLVLTLRQGLIILLIVIAPLAFVAYLLPNTEQWFKKWMGLFQVLLLMFPIISLIFAASSLAGTIIGNSANDVENEGIKIALQSMAAGVTIIPLFITPIVLKAAGGILGKVGAFVNNPNRGPFDRMRKGADGYRSRRKNLMQARRVGRASSTLSGEGGALGGAYSRRRKVAGWVRGSGASRAVNAAEKDKYAEIGANAAKRDYVADRALGDDGYAKSIGGGDSARDIIAYAQQAKKEEQAKDIKAAAATMSHLSNEKVAEMARTGMTHDGSRKLDKHEVAAAAYRIMETGSFDERKNALEYVASNKSSFSADVRNEIVQKSIARGDSNIFGAGFGNQIVDENGSIKDGASLAQAAANNAASGKVSAEHLVQNGASTKYLIDSAQGNTAALTQLKTAAAAARTQAGTASKVTGEFDTQFKRL